MTVTTNNFVGGMNKDLSPLVMPNNVYSHSENFRLTVDSEGTFGSIVNVKGTEYLFTIPSSMSGSGSSYFINAPQYIIGYANIKERLFIFTTANIDEVGGTLYIWEIIYDGITLTTTVHGIAVLSNAGATKRRLIKAHGNYESEHIQKLYWSDGVAYFRSLNVVSDAYPLVPDIGMLDSTPDVTFPLIKLTGTSSGGQLKSGMIQYCYSLYNTHGTQSRISPTTNPFHIVADSDTLSLSTRYRGSDSVDPTTNDRIVAGKVIFGEVTGISSNYDNIRIYSILYGTPTGSPEVNLVAEGKLSGGAFRFKDDGTSLAGMTDTQLLFLGGDPFSCNDFIVKDNRLFPCNIKEDFYDVDYDARAYRFNQIGKAVLHDKNGHIENIILGTTPTYPTSEVLDSINIDQYVYKYKADGTTLGGEGINVSYKFAVTEGGKECIDTSSSVFSFGIESEGDSGIRGINGEWFKNPSYRGYASPFITSLKKGFQRDETYRFAVIFRNKKGQESFPKWIGDIRFPHMSEGSSSLYDLTTIQATDLKTYAKVMGIEFSFKNLPSDAVELEIVYCERDASNRTVISQGLVNPTHSIGGSGASIKDHAALNTVEPITTSAFTRWVVEFETPDVYYDSLPNLRQGDTIKVVGYCDSLSYTDPVSSQNGSAYSSPSASKDLYKFKIVRGAVGGNEQQRIKDSNLIVGSGIVEITNDADFVDFFSFRYKNQTVGIPDKKSTTLVMRLSAAMSAYGSPYGGSGNVDAYPICNIVRNLPKQYGGNSYDERSNSTYISTGYKRRITGSTQTIETYGGDTFIDFFSFYRIIKHGTTASKSQIVYVPVETTMNLSLVQGELYNRNQILETDRDKESDLYQYNKTYSRVNTFKKYFAKPFDFVTNNEFENRWKISDVKIPGEYVDSWTEYREGSYYDVESGYGGITNALKLGENVYFTQTEAVGILHINTRAITATNAGNMEIAVGKDVISHHTYLSTELGASLRGSAISTAGNIYIWDLKKRKFFSLGSNMQNLSDTKGMSSWFNERYSRLKQERVSMVYDHKHNEVYLDMKDYQEVGIASTPFGSTVGDTIIFNVANSALIPTFSKVKLTQSGEIYEGYALSPVSPTQIRVKFDRSIMVAGDYDLNLIDNKTLCYNELTKTFISFYPYKSDVYIKHGNNIIIQSDNSVNFPNLVHILGRGKFNVFFDGGLTSTISFYTNEEATQEKVFDNQVVSCYLYTDNVIEQDIFLDTMKYETAKQNTGNISIVPQISFFTPTNANVRYREGEWNIPLPRASADKDRLRDKWLKTTFTFIPKTDPSGLGGFLDRKVVLDYVKTIFRKSFK